MLAATGGNMAMRGGWKRVMAGLPLIMVQAIGPGTSCCSATTPARSWRCRCGTASRCGYASTRFLCATGNIGYDWRRNDVWYETGQDSGDRETHYPMGRYGDVFTARDAPGLLYAPGNTIICDLQAG